MGNVYVLGNAAVDLSLRVQSLVRPGETIVASSAARSPGGKGLNQAVVAARAGAHVSFCCPTGDDPDAILIEAALQAEPLAVCRPIKKPHPTDISIVTVAADGENSIVSLCACADALTAEEATAFASRVSTEDWLVLQGNLTEAASLAAVQEARGAVLFNPAPIRWNAEALLPYCHVVVANRVEASELTGVVNPEKAIAWVQRRGVRSCVITLGADGYVWQGQNGHGHSAAPFVQAVDTTGAGDTFCGVLAARLAQGRDLRAALLSAQSAAALSVTRAGAFAALPTAAELGRLGPSG